MLLINRNNHPVGLDISDLSLKFVQLKGGKDKIAIQALNKITLEAGIMDKGEIRNGDKLAAALNKLFAKPKFGSVSTDEVNVCLPDTKTFIKLIEVEKSPNPLDEMVKAEIEKHIPIASKDIYFDWQKVAEDQNKHYVLIGASPRQTVNEYIDVLKKAKLTISALEIESIAICRALLKEESPRNKEAVPKSYGIIDIGAKRSNMIVYAANTIALSISMPIAGDEVTSRISSTLDIKQGQAEKAKIICGLDKNKAQGIISEILSGMIEDLTHRIKETLEFYSLHYPSFAPVSEILLCGGGSNIKNIEGIITSKTGVATRLGNVYANVTESKHLPNLVETHSLPGDNDKTGRDIIKQNSALSFATAIGLALRNVFIHE